MINLIEELNVFEKALEQTLENSRNIIKSFSITVGKKDESDEKYYRHFFHYSAYFRYGGFGLQSDNFSVDCHGFLKEHVIIDLFKKKLLSIPDFKLDNTTDKIKLEEYHYGLTLCPVDCPLNKVPHSP